MATFVIVHGAWAGAWAWVRVVDRLRAKGHRVHVPTLSGVGERSHLGHLEINLDTHIADIVNEIRFHDLEDVVLVAHSYGGMVATGVVEQLKAERFLSIVYVDAFVPEDGQSMSSFTSGWELSGHLTDSMPTSKGDYIREEDRAWVNAKATQQPTATFTQKLKVTGAYKKIRKKTYIVATGWDGFTEYAEPLRSQPDWQVREIKCGHDIAIEKPDELTAMLLEAAA